MNWEDKITLCRLANLSGVSLDNRKRFNKFVLENYNQFDLQSWDMFITGCSIIEAEIKEDAEFWKIIIPKIKDIQNKLPSIKSQLRSEAIFIIAETLEI